MNEMCRPHLPTVAMPENSVLCVINCIGHYYFNCSTAAIKIGQKQISLENIGEERFN